MTRDPANSVVKTRFLTVPGASYELVSNPHVTGAELTMGWTRTRRDTSGRVVEVRHVSGAGLPEPWGTNSVSTGTATRSHDAEKTTVTDEVGVTRVTTMDGLGRLASVEEPGIVVQGAAAKTEYAYNVLDNLTTVTQGTQTRSFTYSSLGRLLGANNPESGTIFYTYDANGNLVTRTQAGVTTAYTYDELDQLTGKSYSGEQGQAPTPAVTYTYNHGWRVSAAVAGGTVVENALFDGLGRVKEFKQTTEGTPYLVKYNYNLADGVTQMTYPSGRVVSYTHDAWTGYGKPPEPGGPSGHQNLWPSWKRNWSVICFRKSPDRSRNRVGVPR